jgi:histidine triad (HIT) family protein
MDCIFCQIVNKKKPAKLVYDSEHVIAFHDLHPIAPTHILIIPKKHLHSLNEATLADKELLGHMMLTAPKIAKELGHDHGFRLVMNTGPEGGQTIFHIHLHLLAGKTMHWPLG